MGGETNTQSIFEKYKFFTVQFFLLDRVGNRKFAEKLKSSRKVATKKVEGS